MTNCDAHHISDQAHLPQVNERPSHLSSSLPPRPCKPDDGDSQMEEKDDDIAHPGMVSQPEKHLILAADSIGQRNANSTSKCKSFNGGIRSRNLNSKKRALFKDQLKMPLQVGHSSRA